MTQTDQIATEMQAIAPAAAPTQDDLTAAVPAEPSIETPAPAAEQPTTKRGRRSKQEAAPATEAPASDTPVEAVSAPVAETPVASEPTPAEPVAETPRKRRGRPAKVKAGAPAKAAKPATGDDLRQALHEAIAAKGLSVAEAASAIGVALPGLRRILAGESRPNARTRSAYTAWLGIEVAAAPPAKPGKRGPRPAAEQPGFDLKAAFRALRQIVERSTAAPEAVAAAELDPEIAALCDDELALDVHRASVATRRVVAAALAALAR